MQHGSNCYEKCCIGVLTSWTSPESGFDSRHNNDHSRRKDEPPAETIYVRGRVLSCGINRAILHKPFWDEFRGLRIDLRIIEDRPTTQDSACTLVRVMVLERGDAPNVDHYDAAAGDEVSIIFIIFCTNMCKSHGSHRMPSQYFFRNSIDVWQPSAVRKLWKSIRTDDCV